MLITLKLNRGYQKKKNLKERKGREKKRKKGNHAQI